LNDFGKEQWYYPISPQALCLTWLQRIKEGILTKTVEKKETPDGLWAKCPSCKKAVQTKAVIDSNFVCSCDFHFRIGSNLYFRILFDQSRWTNHFEHILSVDRLNFVDLKAYDERLEATQRKTGLTDAMAVAAGTMNGKELVVACMDFAFIGGSMGSVVGEKISKAVDLCIETNTPLLIISRSGGARMMEAAFSLMQMAKTSAKLALLSRAGIPFISLMTDPTTGGVSASYAMLGDLNIAEPKALIGFAGPRVIRETIKRDLPEGFQRSEFLLEKGFLDKIVDRRDLKSELTLLMSYLRD